MSFATVERIAATRSDEGFYADAPVLEAYHRKRRGVRRKYPVSGRLAGKCDWVGHTLSPQVALESLDITGDGVRGFAELITELAARPRSYAPEVNQDATAVGGAGRENQAVNALFALEFSEPREENEFPHSALTSISREEGVELERVLAAGAPDWVRELRRQLGR